MAGQIEMPDDFDRMGEKEIMQIFKGGCVKLLVDTHQTLMSVVENELFFSADSLRKIVIKFCLGREDFKVDPHLLLRDLLDNGYNELPVLSEHGVADGSYRGSIKILLISYLSPKLWSKV
ncbi:MAG TPA: hypothetical protein VK141_00975 [Nitrosomonas sp.]|nr:hypothetical protein [Nitrosomonas sp.]